MIGNMRLSGGERSAFSKHENSEAHLFAKNAYAEWQTRQADDTVLQVLNSQHKTLVSENKDY